MTVLDFIYDHKGHISEDGRLHFSCVCDGTLLFLYEMVCFLEEIGATDIQYGREETKSPDPERPWLTLRYWASGKLPADFFN